MRTKRRRTGERSDHTVTIDATVWLWVTRVVLQGGYANYSDLVERALLAYLADQHADARPDGRVPGGTDD